MIYSLFIGRYQPFHKGHEALIRKVLDEGKNVLIACRITGVDKQNPYNYHERIKKIRNVFPYKQYGKRVRIIAIPDIEEVVYGRGVGWGVRELKLDKEIENISATKIRRKQNETKKN